MAEGFNAEGWYVGRKDAASEWKGGPYSWEELSAYIAQGRIAPTDLVWHESLPDWVPAASVPGLSAAPTPAPSAPPRKRRGLAIGLSIASALLVLAAAGGGVWAWNAGLLGGKTGSGDAIDMGVAEATVPQRSKLVTTTAYGQVPANQIGIMLKDGAGRRDAETVAKSLNGAVVGEIEFIDTFQIQFPGATEADLNKALTTARTNDKVQIAFANQQVYEDAEIKGVRVTPASDPMYQGASGDGYRQIGLDKAWAFIKGSGVELSDVHVGVVDDGLYPGAEGKESEFGGGVEVDYPDPDAGKLGGRGTHTDGSPNEAGSHGTGVATIIGADPDNGGPTGVAGPLGKKLKISMINHFGGKYGDTTSTPDPNDPTKQVWHDGKTYVIGSLVALTKQVAGGAKVINCSWGNVNADPLDAATYKHFFEKMAADHPDVLFVCSAGNNGQALNGTRRFPSGLSLPNMITVGALNGDGSRAGFSSMKSGNYEVTLGAPGRDAVVGIKGAGGAEAQSGTSFAAPHVTAAAAILRAINPKLSAGEIKQLLVSSARTSTQVGKPGEPGSKLVVAPPSLGGRVLALDQAVLKVINDVRVAKGLKPLTPETLEKMGVIDAIAVTDKPGEYAVTGIVEATGEKGTDVSINVMGENHGIGGKTTQKLGGPGEGKWSVTLPKDQGTILVKRLDNGAASLITIESFDINGHWSGTFTVTDVKITDEEAAKGEGCGAVLFEAMKGKALPMTMDVTADESGNGSAQTLIDVSSLNKDGDGEVSSEPKTFGLSYSGSTVTFDTSGSEGMSGMTGQVSRDNSGLVMKGVMTAGGKGWSIRAVFTLTKPE
jgi:hypothetical protein